MISPLAYVDPAAKIGKNVTIHPFAYIDKNVEIGDNCVIMPYVSIMGGSRIGNNNKFYQGAVVGTPPQDFKHKGEDTIVRIGDNNVIRENAVIIRASAPNMRPSSAMTTSSCRQSAFLMTPQSATAASSETHRRWQGVPSWATVPF